MIDPNTLLRITYTAPGSPDRGQDRSYARLDGDALSIDAVCQSDLLIRHPPGQRLLLSHASLRIEDSGDHLAIRLPEDEHDLDLLLVTEPAGATAKIKVTTKKEGSKPDPPRTASFRR